MDAPYCSGHNYNNKVASRRSVVLHLSRHDRGLVVKGPRNVTQGSKFVAGRRKDIKKIIEKIPLIYDSNCTKPSSFSYGTN
jgi:hypothetical protein